LTSAEATALLDTAEADSSMLRVYVVVALRTSAELRVPETTNGLAGCSSQSL
jgi:hypothetical protein